MSQAATQRQIATVGAMYMIVRRHKTDEGLCRCCGQPWPCDAQRLWNLMMQQRGEEKL